MAVNIVRKSKNEDEEEKRKQLLAQMQENSQARKNAEIQAVKNSNVKFNNPYVGGGTYLAGKYVAGLGEGTTNIVSAPMQTLALGFQQGSKQASKEQTTWDKIKNIGKNTFKTFAYADPTMITRLMYDTTVGRDEFIQNANEVNTQIRQNASQADSTWKKATAYLGGYGSFIQKQYLNSGLNQLQTGAQSVGQVLGSEKSQQASQALLEADDKLHEPIDKLNEELSKSEGSQNKVIRRLGNASYTIGNMTPSILISALSGGAGASDATREALSLTSMGISAKGGSTREGLKQGLDLSTAERIGVSKGMVEVGTEKMWNGLSFLKSPDSKVGSAIRTWIGKQVEDRIKSQFGKTVLTKWIPDLAGETLEEFVSGIYDNWLDRATVDPNRGSFFKEQSLDTLIDTTLSTLLMNAPSYVLETKAIHDRNKSGNQTNVNIEESNGYKQNLQEMVNNLDIPNEMKAELQQTIDSNETITGEEYNNTKERIKSLVKQNTQQQIDSLSNNLNNKYIDINNRLSELDNIKAENFKDQESRRFYAQQMNKEFSDNTLDAILATYPENRNGNRTVKQYKEIAKAYGEQMALNGLTFDEVRANTVGAWQYYEPNKNITRYDNQQKKNASFERLNSQVWSEEVYNSYRDTMKAQLDQQQKDLADTANARLEEIQDEENILIDTIDNLKPRATAEQVAKTKKLVEDFAKARGVNVEYNAEVFKNSNEEAFIKDNGNGERTIYINPNADPDTILVKLATHEMFHDTIRTEPHDKLTKLVMDKLQEDENYNMYRQSVIEAYQEQLEGKTQAEQDAIIDEEMTAKYLGEYLGDEQFVQQLVNSTNRSTIQKIMDWIDNRLQQIKNVVTGNKEAEYWRKVRENFEKAYNSEYQGQEGTKYSINENTEKQVKSQQGSFNLPKNVNEIKNTREWLRKAVENETNTEWKERLKDASRSNYDTWTRRESPLKWRREIIQQYLDYKNEQNNTNVNDNVTTDDQGRTLTKEQQEYFKNSKVRDENGNLITLYHGTNNDFNTFERGSGEQGDGYYFTNDDNYAYEYADDEEDGRVVEAYLNLTNPLERINNTNSQDQMKFVDFISDTYNIPKNDVIDMMKDEDWTALIGEQVALKEGHTYQEVADWLGWDIDDVETEDVNFKEYLGSYAWEEVLNKKARELGYDGIISRIYNSDAEGYEFIAFNSNQIKNVDNTNPTTNPDIRYSKKTDFDNFLNENNYKFTTDGRLETGKLSEKQIKTLLNLYKTTGYEDVSPDFIRNRLESNSLVIPREVADRFIEKELGYKPKFDTTKIYEDAEGRKLTKEQVEFYKDSDVRDIQGRLIPVYHRTNADFTIFDKNAGKQHGNKYGSGFYFSITPENYGNNTMEVYLNAKEGEYKYIPKKGYYIVQNANQIKNIDNLKPTDNPDIRYSKKTAFDKALREENNKDYSKLSSVFSNLNQDIQETLLDIYKDDLSVLENEDKTIITETKEELQKQLDSLEDNDENWSERYDVKAKLNALKKGFNSLYEYYLGDKLDSIADDFKRNPSKYDYKIEELNKKKERQKQLDEEIKKSDPFKLAQYNITQATNPMFDDYHKGIRSPADILTFEEAVQDEDSFNWGDYSRADAERDLKRNKVRVYSSFPIKNGTFVSTSYVQALWYAGNNPANVHSKEVNPNRVAWLDGDEGQYASVTPQELEKAKNQQSNTNYNIKSKTYDDYLKANNPNRSGVTIGDLQQRLPANQPETTQPILPTTNVQPTTESLEIPNEQTSLPLGEQVNPSERKQRKAYKSIIESPVMSEEAKKVARKFIGQDTYTPDSNLKQLERADNIISRLGTEKALNQLESNAIEGRTIKAEDIATGDRLIQYYSLIGDSENLQRAIRATAMAGTQAGRSVQAFALLKHQTPQGMAIWIQNSVDKLNSQMKKGQFDFTPEMQEKILNSTEENLQENANEVMKELGQQVPQDLLGKLDSWRYFSMLANPKTHIRNIVGNFAMGLTQQFKSKVAGTIEQVTGQDRTHTSFLEKRNKANTDFAKNDLKNVAAQLGIGESKYSNPKNQIQQNQRVFKSDALEKTLGRMFKLNDNLLEAEDSFGLKNAYVRNLSDYMTANKLNPNTITNEQLQQARKVAIDEALRATFHQESSLASMLNQIENKNLASRVLMGGLVPFKKTPINVAKSGFEYSPAGLAKAIVYDSVQLRKGNINVNEYIDNISKGLTGTGIALVGYALAEAGILKAGGDDDKEDKYKEAMGEQPYSITINGKSYSLDWLAPTGIPLFVGAELNKLVHDTTEKEGETQNGVLKAIGRVTDATSSLLNPMSEMSMISGLTSTIQSFSTDPGGALMNLVVSPVKSYVGQVVPTAVGQVARTMDKYERDTSSTETGLLPKAIDQTKNQIMNKIPGLRQLLPTKKDIWGNEVETQDYFHNAVLPYTKKEVKTNAVDKELNDLYERTGESIYPNTSLSKTVTYEGSKTRLTNQDYNEFKTNYGKTSYKLLEDLTKSQEYKGMTDAQKVQAIKDVYTYANNLNKTEYAEKKGIEFKTPTDVQQVRAVKAYGGKESDYFKYKGITDGLSKDSEKMVALRDSNLSAKSKRAVYSATLGKDDTFFQSTDINVNEYLGYKTANIQGVKGSNGKTISGSKKAAQLDYINNNISGYENRLLLMGKDYKLSRSQQQDLAEYIYTLDNADDLFAMYDKNFTVRDGTVYYK